MAIKLISALSTPKHIQFKNSAGTNTGKIEASGDDLVISNAVGDVLFGDIDSDVYIGDGVNNVNIIFEQSGSIKGENGGSATLTVGSNSTVLNLYNPQIENNMALTSTMTIGVGGYIDFIPDTGVFLKFDGQNILERTTVNGGLILGHDDGVIIAGGDTSTTLKANVGVGNELVTIGSEGGLQVLAFPDNDTSWANRERWNFSNDGKLYFGTANDTNLYRSAANTLKTDNSFVVGDNFTKEGSGGLFKLYVPSWTSGNQNHDVLYNGWNSSLSDYVYLKASGNSTGGHGAAIIGDDGFYVGRTNSESGAIVDSTTVPLDSDVWFYATPSKFVVNDDLEVAGEIAIGGGQSADDARMHFRASDNSNRFTIETDLDGTTTNDLLGFRSTSTDNILVLKGDGSVLLGGANNNSGKADFAVNVGGSDGAALSFSGTQVQVGGQDINYTFRLDSSGGNGRIKSWAGDIVLSTDESTASTSRRDIILTTKASGVANAEAVRVKGGGVVQIHNLGAGLVQSDSSGNLSIDTNSYATQTWVGEQNYASDAAISTALASYLPLAGGTMTGTINIGSSTNNGAAIKLIKSTSSPEIRIQAGESGVSAFTIYNTATNPDAEQFFINNTLGTSHLGNKRGALKLESSSGVVLTLSGSSATFAGTVTASGGNSGNWNTAYGWGNHGSAGYLTTSSAATTYAPKASPALTGTPTAPTAGSTTNTTQLATTAFVQTAIANLADSAPSTLNTLNELAAALGDDANFATTTSTSLGNRLRVDTASQGLNSTQKSNGRTNLGLGTIAVTATTDFVSSGGNDIITHATNQHGLAIYTSGGGIPSTSQLKIGRGSTQYWGVFTDDGTANLVHRQDETGAGDNHHTQFQIWSSGGGTHSWRWQLADNAGANGAEKMKLTADSELILGGGSNTITNTKAGQWDTAYGWGNHASAGYLTSETFSSSDVVVSLSGTDVTAGESITLAGGLSYSGTTLTSANDNTTYTAGTGLTLTGTSFSVTANTYAAASHTHAAGDITSGTFATARIPSLAASKISSGTLNADRLPRPLSGDWWNGGAAIVGTDGVMEVGKYMDWHDSDTETSDFSYRMTASNTNMTFSGTISATGYNDANWNTAYGWGNHASAGYLTSYTETDTLDSVADRGATTNQAITTGGITATYGHFGGTGSNPQVRIYTEDESASIADTFTDTTTDKSYIYFMAGTSSNDAGYIMHETSNASSPDERNEGVLHLVPSDDNSTGDYVSIHGTNDPDCIKLHTSGLVETSSSYQLQLRSGSGIVRVDDGLEVIEYISHVGDSDTYVRFEDNRIRIAAGGTVKFDTNSTYLTSETFSSSDVVLSLSGNDITAGDSITLAGGLSYNSSTNTLSQTDNNTTYTVGDGGLTQKNFTTTLKNKLDGIAASANNYTLPVAGSSIGGVKSGTDITVDASGNVSVNNHSHSHQAENVTGGVLGQSGQIALANHPEGGAMLTPSFENDLAFIVDRGGSVSVYYTNSTDYTALTLNNTGTAGFSNTIPFNGKTNYTYATLPSASSVVVYDIEMPFGLSYGNTFYVDFGAGAWQAKDVTFLAFNSSSDNSQQVYKVVGNTFNNVSSGLKFTAGSYNYIRSSDNGTSYSYNRLRVVMGNWGRTGVRIAAIGAKYYNSGSLTETLLSKGGGSVYGDIAATGTVTASNLNVSNWNTAYGWGNHGSAGYLTTHPSISSASSVNNSGRTYIQDITVDSNGHVTAINSATETVVNTDTTYSVGDGGLTQKNFTTTLKTKLDGIAASANNYSLPAGDASTRGGFKIGYSENGKNYPVEVSSEKMYVNVPWTDANTNYYLNGITKSGNTLTFAVNGATNQTYTFGSNAFNSTAYSTASGVEDNADVTDTTNVVAALTAGTNVQIAANGTISATDTDTVYTHPTSAGNKHVPTGGAAGQFLKYSSSGTAVWATPSYTTNTDTVYTHPTSAGNKHIPSGGSAGQFLKYSASGTATWATPSYTTNTNTQLSNEQVQDIVGAMFSGNSESNITATYQDGDGTIDLAVAANYGSWNLVDTGDSVNRVDSTEHVKFEGANISGTGTSADPFLVNTPDTNTTYSAGGGLDLTGTTFSIESDLRDGITRIGKDTSNYIAIGADTNVIDFHVGGVWVARMESDGDLHMKGDVIAFSDIFNP